MKDKELTIKIENGENGYFVGHIEEYPAVMSQGHTIEELKETLKDALILYLVVQKML